MIVILLGPPGSGKGTQGLFLKQYLNFKHISTGDILRLEVNKGTSLGLKAKDYMNRGLLVPDELIIQMMKNLISSNPKDDYVLDGFPRTISQAEALDNMLSELGLQINKVFYFNIEDDVVIKRLSGRRVCPKCGATYNIYYQKPKNDNMCDNDNTPLIQRDDDKEDVIKNRLKVYKEQTYPLVDFYKKNNKLIMISADDTQEKIFEKLKSLL